MNVDKNVKKSFILKIRSGVSRVSGGKSSLEVAKNAENPALEMAFLNALSRVNTPPFVSTFLNTPPSFLWRFFENKG